MAEAVVCGREELTGEGSGLNFCSWPSYFFYPCALAVDSFVAFPTEFADSFVLVGLGELYKLRPIVKVPSQSLVILG